MQCHRRQAVAVDVRGDSTGAAGAARHEQPGASARLPIGLRQTGQSIDPDTSAACGTASSAGSIAKAAAAAAPPAAWV